MPDVKEHLAHGSEPGCSTEVAKGPRNPVTSVTLEPVEIASAPLERRVATKNPWCNRPLLLIVLGLFVTSRVATLMVFPIFNDEAIYLQYAQAIHEDFQLNKFISMQGDWADWKPPLQYWVAAPVIQLGNDPLVAGRGVALLVSLLGLIGSYLFAREFFGRKEALVTALLYFICPSVLFQNNQFTAETFLFSIAPFFYVAIIRMLRPGYDWAAWWVLLGVVSGTALLLLKQSGALLLAMAIALPLAGKPRETGVDARRGPGVDWKRVALNILLVGALIAVSHLLAWQILPAESETTQQRFNSRWVMSVDELVHFPIGVWEANLHVVGQYIGAYYSWALLILVLAFICFAFYRRDRSELTIAIMCLVGAGAVTIVLRQFNEYIFNTAIIAVLLPLLARLGVLVWEMPKRGQSRFVRSVLLVCGGLMLAHWGYQLVLMSVAPGKYIERSTPWANANYLKRWSTGFGMKKVVALLEEQNGRGILFADTQWGNPLTTLQIYGPTRFPNLKIVPISREFLNPDETRKLRDAVMRIDGVRLVVYSADASDERGQWQRNVEEQMCVSRREIREYPGQTPIIVCAF